jgi:hypothetical protein
MTNYCSFLILCEYKKIATASTTNLGSQVELTHEKTEAKNVVLLSFFNFGYLHYIPVPTGKVWMGKTKLLEEKKLFE